MNTYTWWDRDDLCVEYDPTRRVAQAGELLVGVGEPSDADAGITLNHKSAQGGSAGVGRPSLSAHVHDADDATRARWRRLCPAGIGSIRRIVVEDASPDTCLALLMFAWFVRPEATPGMAWDSLDPPVREAWRDYITQWEQGRYGDGAEPRDSVACQLAMLSHLLLTPGGRGGRPTDETARHAVQACLNLLEAYVSQRVAPQAVRHPVGVREFEMADAQLHFELQRYQLALEHGIRTQLMVPMAGTGRSVLVDALFVTDLDMAGIHKVLARADTEHTYTQRGYAVLGIHRPELAGTGFDMTISVDPRRGLSLEALWDRLERMEAERWGADRPADRPRRGIRKYADAAGTPSPGAPNEPWYDEQGAYTILGAPKAVAPGVPGSRLDWQRDVLAAVWDLHAPVREQDVELEAVQRAGGRTVRSVRWRHREASAGHRSPALHQWLAGWSSPQAPRHPGEFVPQADLQVVELPGGCVVVHPRGITLFDDWTGVDFEAGDLHAFACTLAELASAYADILQGHELRSLMDESVDLLKSTAPYGFRTVADFRARAMRLRAQLLELTSREAAAPLARGEDDVRRAIEQAWKLPQARHELWDMLARTDELITQAHDLMQERRQFIAATLLSTAAVFVVFREALDVWKDKATMNVYELTLPLWKRMGIDATDADAFKALKADAALEDRFNTATLTVMLVVFLIGAVWGLYRYLGPRGRATSGHPPA